METEMYLKQKGPPKRTFSSNLNHLILQSAAVKCLDPLELSSKHVGFSANFVLHNS